DGARVLSLSSRAARVWDAKSGKEIRVFNQDPREGFGFATLSPDGQRILTGRIVRIWDANSGKDSLALPESGIAAFSPDGKRVIGGGSREVRIWDAASGKEIRKFRGHARGVSDVALSPDGKRALSVGMADGTARLWDVDSGKQIQALPWLA